MQEFFEYNSGKLCYEIVGNGTSIVFIHGFGLDRRMWQDQVDFFKSNYQCISIDMRGYGLSELPTGPYSHHEDLEKLLDHLKIERAHIVGLSFGGELAIDFTITYPDRVLSLAILDASISGYPEKENWDVQAKEEGIEKAKENWLNHRLFDGTRDKLDVMKKVENIVRDYSGWHWINDDPRTKLSPRAYEQVISISLPILIMVGEDDLLYFQHIAKDLAKRIPNSLLYTISNCGHMSNMEASEFVNEKLLALFEKMKIYSFGNIKDRDRTVTITAGMDGDELAGIEAAHALIRKLGNLKVNGKVFLVPIVNQKGFKAFSSYNPIDQKYPKNIYPGKQSGSDSEELVFELVYKCVRKSSVWIDLHSGGKTEFLKPYFYVYETDKGLSKLGKLALNKLKADKAISVPYGVWNKSDYLTRDGIDYLILEAGYGGRKEKKDINKLVEWTINLLEFKGLLALNQNDNYQKRIYHNLATIKATHDGLWCPSIRHRLQVDENEKIGEIFSENGESLQVVTSPSFGEVLWITQKGKCFNGDELLSIGFDGDLSF